MKKTPVAKTASAEYSGSLSDLRITTKFDNDFTRMYAETAAAEMKRQIDEAMLMAVAKPRSSVTKTALMAVEAEAQKRLPKLSSPEYYIVKAEHMLTYDSIRISVKVMNGEVPSQSYIYNVDIPVLVFEMAAPGDWRVLDDSMESITGMIVKDKVKYILNERKQNELHRQAQQQESTQPWAVYELRDGTSSNSQADPEAGI